MLWLFKQPATEGAQKLSYRFWQPGNHAEICFNLSFTWQKLSYIHNNPVRADIVTKAEDYKYSSAADYYYGKQVGKIKTSLLNSIIKTS